MLRVPADFPHAGSAAFLRGEPAEQPRPGMAWPAEAVRIIRWNPPVAGEPDTALVAITGKRALAEIASGNLTAPRTRLFATLAEAMFPGKPARRKKAA